MSGPDPKELRVSLVDSGWSTAPPAPVEEGAAPSAGARPLPPYDEIGTPPVTQVDRHLQERLRAMERATVHDLSAGSEPLPPPPTSGGAAGASVGLPPPPVRPSSTSSLPPPRAPLATLPLGESASSGPLPQRRPSLPPPPAPPPRRSSVPPPFVPASAAPVAPAPVIAVAAAPVPPVAPPGVGAPGIAPPSVDAPPVVSSPRAVLPAVSPPVAAFPSPAVAEPAPWPSAAPAVPPHASQPTLPLASPATPPEWTRGEAAAERKSLGPSPSLQAALGQRVRFAGGEVPLWTLIAPFVVLLALGAAFAAAAVARPEEASSAPASSSSVATATEAPSSAATGATAVAPSAPKPPRVDTAALEARAPQDLTVVEALQVAESRRARELAEVLALRERLERDPGLFKDPALLLELRRAAEDPLTAPEALGAMARAPGALAGDLLYEMWTGTVAKNSATELARALVLSKDVRARASEPLAVALDLRVAETCEASKAVLARANEHADRRAVPLLGKLTRKFGCGANKRQDCFPCLRDDSAVEDALTAAKKRKEPRPFAAK